jgi:hypothetical protein
MLLKLYGPIRVPQTKVVKHIRILGRMCARFLHGPALFHLNVTTNSTDEGDLGGDLLSIKALCGS